VDIRTGQEWGSAEGVASHSLLGKLALNADMLIPEVTNSAVNAAVL
jgi:hypothetical protein